MIAPVLNTSTVIAKGSPGVASTWSGVAETRTGQAAGSITVRGRRRGRRRTGSSGGTAHHTPPARGRTRPGGAGSASRPRLPSTRRRGVADEHVGGVAGGRAERSDPTRGGRRVAQAQ